MNSSGTSYKTIVVHVDESAGAEARYETAAVLANAHGAHLIGLASTGVARFMRDTVAMDFASASLAPLFQTLNDRADKALDRFERVVAGLGVNLAERRRIEDEPSESLAVLARYCDLCVVGQYDPDAPTSAVRATLPSDVAAGGGCPVLVVPNRGLRTGPMRRIMVGWDGGREAARALHHALPLLGRADNVDVVILGDRAADLGGGLRIDIAIGQALDRHGIHADIVHQAEAENAGATLLQLAAERGAELLVMGCYGHSRMRERFLGGATRTVLGSMELPVLMAS